MRNDINEQKAVIIGCGMVGSTIAYTLMQSGTFSQIVLIDSDEERLCGEVMDLGNGIPFMDGVNVYAGNYDDIKDAFLVIISAGASQKPGESRMDLLETNVKIYREIISKINDSGFKGNILVASNPVDILTYVAQEMSNLPYNRVLGTGTVLDTARLKYEIGKELAVNSRNIHAMIVGEHGDREIALFSSANVSGIPLLEYPSREPVNKVKLLTRIRNYAYEIIKRKKATYYGIAMAVKRIAEALVRDEKAILPVSTRVEDEDGEVVLSVPSVISKNGARYIEEYPMSEDEKAELENLKNEMKRIYKLMEK